jgi:hypothetical protein
MLATACRSVVALVLVILPTVTVNADHPARDSSFTFEQFAGNRSHGLFRYGSAESVFLKFDPFGGDQPVAEQLLAGADTQTLLRADDANSNSVGPRITLGWIDLDNRGWELSYLGVGGGRGSRSVDGDGNLAMVGTLALNSSDFFNSDRIAIDAETRLYSFEINRTWNDERWSLLAGFRYVRVEDSFRLLSFESDTGIGSDFTSFGDYSVETDNDLFGLQSGIRHKRRSRLSERLFFGLGGKAGIYGNSASQSQSIIDFGGTDQPFPLRPPFRDHRGQVAFVGETNLTADLALTSNLELRVGYNLIWMDGLALAPGQLELDDAPITATSTTGGGLFHGASVGFIFKW